jgi:hypothetical protein
MQNEGVLFFETEGVFARQTGRLLRGISRANYSYCGHYGGGKQYNSHVPTCSLIPTPQKLRAPHWSGEST